MAKFVQVIEFETSKIDEIRKLDEEWMSATEGKRTASRSLLCVDRDHPNHYVVIVEFPSYEAAMKNNELPETQHFADEQMKRAEGETKFYNLEVLQEDSL